MSIIVDKFYEPMIRNQVLSEQGTWGEMSGPFDTIDAAEIFSNVGELREFSAAIVDRLDARLRSWSCRQLLGTV